MKKKMSFLCFYGIMNIIIGYALIILFKCNYQELIQKPESSIAIYVTLGILIVSTIIVFINGWQKKDEMDDHYIDLAGISTLYFALTLAILFCLGKFIPAIEKFRLFLKIETVEDMCTHLISLGICSRGIVLLIRDFELKRTYKKNIQSDK